VSDAAATVRAERDDLLHLMAARKAGAQRLITLNRRAFEALCKPGDPVVHGLDTLVSGHSG